MLGSDGRVSEGTGENIFVVRKGVVITSAPSASSALPGITGARLSQSQEILATIFDLSHWSEPTHPSEEMFLTETAAEVTPVRTVDDREFERVIAVLSRPRYSSTYFQVVHGELERYFDWLDWP